MQLVLIYNWEMVARSRLLLVLDLFLISTLH